MFTSTADPTLTAINVHFVGDSSSSALCHASGDAASPDVTFDDIAD